MNKKKEEYFKFCPKCGSKKIRLTRLIADIVLADFKFYECENCKWRGTPYEGTEEFIRKFKQKINAKNKKRK